MALHKSKPLLQEGQRVKGHVRDLVARVCDGTERKGLNTFDEREITSGIINEHKSSLEPGDDTLLALPYPNRTAEVKAHSPASAGAI
jgi:hypothetical protein